MRLTGTTTLRLPAAALVTLALSLGSLWGQDAATDDIDALFDDPGAMEIIDSAAGDSGATGGAAVAVSPAAAAPSADQGYFRWFGDFSSTVGVNANYADTLPSLSDLQSPDESLDLGVTARLWFDASPDRHYRAFGKLKADYPFEKSHVVTDVSDPASPATATVTAPNVSIFELFAEFDWNDRLFFRFGKQTAGWGLSRFYQIADPLSVGVKDPADPGMDLEGPLALRVAFPLDVNNLYFYAVLKDSYLPKDGENASVTNAGYGVKGDFLVRVPRNPVLSNGELTLGAYYQKDLAPKAVIGYSTGIGTVQVFTDQAFSWGLDSARLTDEEEFAPGSGIYKTVKPDEEIFWSATLGAMYVNNDWHFTGYGEYLYNGAGTDDPRYIEKWTARYGAEAMHGSPLEPSLVAADLFGYLGRHNSALSLSWSELFGSDKLSASVLYLQNWIDRSGMVSPSLTLSPFDHFAVVAGVSMIWGGSNNEWVLKNAGLSASDPGNVSYRRFVGKLAFKLGGGKF